MSGFIYVCSFGISILLFICAAGTSAFAQDSKISREEFDRVRATYKGFLAKEPHRIRYVHETFPSEDAKEPEKTSLWLTEFEPPDREHNYYGLNSTNLGDKYERVVIGSDIFIKRDGTWKKLEFSKGPQPPPGVSATTEYFVLGTERIGDQIATIYEVIGGSNFSRGRGPMQTSFYKSKYWISKDGRMLKYVGESDALITKRNRTTEVYEYDPKIKIEVPIP